MSLQDTKKKIRAFFAKIKLKVAIKKLSVALMIVSIALANTPMSYTVAKLVDMEVSGNNIFAAGTLDQSLSSGPDFSPAVLPGGVVATKDMAIGNNGSLGFQYTIFATNTVGALCDNLSLQAILNGVQVYNGPLKLFSYEVADYSSTTTNWHFEASLPSGATYALQNQTCNVDFNVFAKQKDLASGVGFSDLETMANAILAGTWKIEGIWVQTTVDDFNAGVSSYTSDGKEEILVTPAADGTGDAQIATGGVIPPVTITESKDGDGNHLPKNAIDENDDTAWKGTNGHDTWLMIDLGQNYPIERVRLYVDKIKEGYSLAISKTGAFAGEETIIATTTLSLSGEKIYNLSSPVEGRYVRLYINAMSGNPWVYEFQVLKRELPSFDGTATLTSQTFDSGKMTKWTKLEWNDTIPTGTDISLAIQTSNDGLNWGSAWLLKAASSPINLSSLPLSRYVRWQAELTTNTLTPPITTPILHDVSVYYEQEEAQKFVVLNEYLPYPSSTTWGYDSSLKPQGEWIELYNNGSSAIDLDGFYFQNALGTKKYISKATAFTTTNTGDTVINSHDWLVVYMNGEFMSNSGDTIAFYDLFGNPVDSHTFDLANACTIPTPDSANTSTSAGTCTTVPANKSFARIPDGTGSWVDPIPTPGSANVLEVVPMNEFAEKLNDLLIVSTSSEETTTQEIADLPMESTGASAPIPEAADTLSSQPDLTLTTSTAEVASMTLPAMAEATSTPESATSTPEIIPEIVTTTTTSSVEATQPATTSPEILVESAVAVPAPAPVVTEVSTPVEPQPATDQTQTPEVLQEAPTNPDPQPASEPTPEVAPSITETPASSEPAPEATPNQTAI